MKPVRTLLVDDNPEFLNSAAGFLSTSPQIEIVGLAQSAREGMRLAGELSPDLLLIDLSMPEMNGIETTRRIKQLPMAPKVIILTLHNNIAYRVAAENAGADAFISKADFVEALLPAICRLFDLL
ncbi:MAG TPA: response regulator transcription factor [Verrucomicrobiae bacterium]|nr:response regulator transcription factor [Verrucomicrobiae bacterium]